MIDPIQSSLVWREGSTHTHCDQYTLCCTRMRTSSATCSHCSHTYSSCTTHVPTSAATVLVSTHGAVYVRSIDPFPPCVDALLISLHCMRVCVYVRTHSYCTYQCEVELHFPAHLHRHCTVFRYSERVSAVCIIVQYGGASCMMRLFVSH